MVTLPWRRRPLPAAGRPSLEPDERVVAWAGAAGDAVVVATTRGLWLPPTGRPGSLPPTGRLGWHEIHKATWSARQLSIIAAVEVADEGSYRIMADLPPLVITLLDPDGIPDQVRARVTRSVAYSAHHRLPGGGGVRVVARRVSGVDGLRWTVRYDQGTDTTAAEVAGMTAEFVAAGRTAVEPSDG